MSIKVYTRSEFKKMMMEKHHLTVKKCPKMVNDGAVVVIFCPVHGDVTMISRDARYYGCKQCYVRRYNKKVSASSRYEKVKSQQLIDTLSNG